MRIYYALTTYHILCCVLHCMTEKTDEKSVLLLSDIHKNSVAFLDRYRQSGIFDEVYLLPEAQITDLTRSLERRNVPMRLILKIACKMMKKGLPVPVSRKDHLFLCPDHFPFGWLVVTSRYPYVCFEEGCGVLSDRDFALTNMSRNKTQRRLYDKLQLFGDNDNAIAVLADTNKQKEGYQNPKMRHFSVVDLLASLPEAQLETVLSFFGCKKENIAPPFGLLLTQHLANLGLMPLGEQHRLYTLFADYFLDGMHLVIKPHPDDIAGCYQTVFGGKATVLPFAMPSELLPFCVDGQFEKAAAAYSTAVRSLGGCAKEAFSFDERILTDYRYLFAYHCAGMLLDALGIQKAETNANELLLRQFSKTDVQHVEGAQCTDGTDVFILSDLDETITEQTVSEILKSGDKLVLFLNEKNRYLFFDGVDYSVFKHCRPVFIDFSNGEKKEIYAYTKREDIMQKINDIKAQKELKYTGLTVDLHGISKAESEKIRVLEGVLQATESRLNAYIEKAREEPEK
mgnify:CR=1 FL=1